MNNKLKASLFLISGITAFLNSCVTTTTGGFSVEPSEEQALQDYVRLAAGYYDAGDMAGARRHINNALAIDNRDSGIYNILALIYQREGDLDLAESNFRKSVRLDKGNSRARNNFAVYLFSNNRFQEAYEQLEIVTADTAYEGRSRAFENLGRIALQIPGNDRSTYAFERALRLDGNMYRSALELAQIKISEGNFALASSYYSRYLTTTSFYNIDHSAQSLWIGIQLERHLNNQRAELNYVVMLQGLFQYSPEYQLYRNSIDE